MATRIKLRNDTGANWTAVNPVLAKGEAGLELAAGIWRMKIGDGVTPWRTLSYQFEIEGGGGSATFSGLTDAETADLPAINTPLATVLAGKASLAGNNTFTAQQEFTDSSTWIYTPASAANHRSSLGSTAVGDALFVAADASAARIALGAGTTGAELFQAATAEAARSTLGTIRREATTDYTSSSTTLTSAPELTFPVEAGKTYRVDLALVVSSLAAVGGVQVAMSYPALSRTGFGFAQTQLNQTVKFPNLGASSVNLNTNTTGVPNGTTGLTGWVHLRPTSSGNVTFAAGQFSAGTGTVGILAGSIITVTEL